MIGETMMSADEIFKKCQNILNELLTCPFGIPYLDDAILGMSPGEVTLLGARSGSGKTEAATQIVLEQQNHEKNKAKSVLYIALDHEPGEIENRVMWRLLVDQIKTVRPAQFHGVTLRYAAWRKGKYRDLLDAFEGDSRVYLKHLFSLSETRFIYQKGAMTARQIADLIAVGGFNLYVIDHFHAVRGIDKLEEQGEAITAICRAAETVDRPVLILGQFRKGSTIGKSPIPSMEDFAGSSQLHYQPQNIIVLAPKYGDDHTKWETYFHVVKSRVASDAKAFVGIHSFDMERKQYSEKYSIGRFKPLSEPAELPISQIPAWAKNASGPLVITKPKGASPYRDD